MTEEEMEKDESNEKPKTIGDLRREAAESLRSEEEAKAALKALLDLMDRVEEWRQSASDDQRKRLAQFEKEMQSPIFGVDLAQLDEARDIKKAEREIERPDMLLRQQIPSPEVMALREAREARKEKRRWQIAFFVVTIIGIVMTAISIVITLWALRAS